MNVHIWFDLQWPYSGTLLSMRGCIWEKQQVGGGSYFLVELEKLHRHVALKLGPCPTGKHAQSSDDHRVEDLEIQGDGRHIRGGKHGGVRHRHDLYLFILTCHWDRGAAVTTAQAHVKFIITVPRWLSLFTVMKTEWVGAAGGRVLKKEGRLKIHHQHSRFEGCLCKTSFCSWVRFLNYKRAVCYPGDQWKDQGC